jgi:hypothetical protein
LIECRDSLKNVRGLKLTNMTLLSGEDFWKLIQFMPALHGLSLECFQIGQHFDRFPSVLGSLIKFSINLGDRDQFLQLCSCALPALLNLEHLGLTIEDPAVLCDTDMETLCEVLMRLMNLKEIHLKYTLTRDVINAYLGKLSQISCRLDSLSLHSELEYNSDHYGIDKSDPIRFPSHSFSALKSFSLQIYWGREETESFFENAQSMVNLESLELNSLNFYDSMLGRFLESLHSLVKIKLVDVICSRLKPSLELQARALVSIVKNIYDVTILCCRSYSFEQEVMKEFFNSLTAGDCKCSALTLSYDLRFCFPELIWETSGILERNLLLCYFPILESYTHLKTNLLCRNLSYQTTHCKILLLHLFQKLRNHSESTVDFNLMKFIIGFRFST